jgi:hypothetical protein
VRDQGEPLVTSQLTPSQTAMTEAALGRPFIFAQHQARHGCPDDGGGSLNSQRYSNAASYIESK